MLNKLVSILFFVCAFIGYAQEFSKCKVTLGESTLQQLNALGIPTDHGTLKKGHYFISDFSQHELQLMDANQIVYEVLIEDVKEFYRSRSLVEQTRNSNCEQSTNENLIETPTHFNLGSMGGYLTYTELLAELDEMQSLYPDLITVKAPIDTFLTHEGRPIYWVKISDFASNDDPEPEVLYTAIHHAREPASLSSTIFYMWYLLENYATNTEIQYLVNETEMYFVPVINPDGYIYNETTDPSGGGMWRKNRRNLGNGVFGVDLNRNYSYEWGTTGISFDQTSDVYPGDMAFSEPETKAMKWFCENRDFLYAFNAHTYSNLMLFPIGSTTTEFAEDHDYLQALGNEMVRYNGFVAQKSSALYPASGDSDDYMYKMDLTEKPKIFAYTPEIGSDADGFWPASSSIEGLCKGMVHANLVLAEAAHNYWLVVENDPTVIETTTGNFHIDAKRLGIVDADVTISLEAVTGITSISSSQTISLPMNGNQEVTFDYVLDASISLGDPIAYILHTDLGDRILHDTIRKTFGNPTLQLVDPADNANNWVGNWNTTSSTYYSSSQSFTESPNATYANNTTKTYQLAQTIDLTHATVAKVQFYARWEIEDQYDFVQFQVSIDGGNTWQAQCGKYTNAGVGGNGGVQQTGLPVYDGFQTEWVLEEISLSDYLGEQILCRFLFKSDGGVREDGFYFDDFEVMYDVDNLGTDEETQQMFQVFPNPVQNELTLSSNKGFTQKEISIYDINGMLVYWSQMDMAQNEVQLSVGQLARGIYFLSIDHQKPIKFVKQ